MRNILDEKTLVPISALAFLLASAAWTVGLYKDVQSAQANIQNLQGDNEALRGAIIEIKVSLAGIQTNVQSIDGRLDRMSTFMQAMSRHAK